MAKKTEKNQKKTEKAKKILDKENFEKVGKLKFSKETAVESLKKIVDPELGIDIWTLGLIYDIAIEKRYIKIKMTFTSPMCPYGPMLLENIKKELSDRGFDPDIEVVFTPVWQPSKEIRMMLGLA